LKGEICKSEETLKQVQGDGRGRINEMIVLLIR